MKPGRELDALVAQTVMGWQLKPFDRHEHRGSFALMDGPIPENIERAWVNAQLEAIPNYSTDIAAAWEVVKKLQNQGRSLKLDWGKSRWLLCSHMEGDGTGYTFVSSEAETAPHAICLAALKAVRGTNGHQGKTV